MTLSIKELIVEADRCVACGLCLPHCPTYRKTGSEADSPRGRIQLMRAVAQEILPNNDRFKAHIDLCLSCRSCESACPNNVNYGALVDTSRALFTRKKSPISAIVKVLIRERIIANVGIWLIWLAQQSGLMGVIKRISHGAKILPSVEKPVTWQTLYPAFNSKKSAVSLFLGCAGNALDSQTLKASIYVLNTLGYDVHIPSTQTCCGSIARQSGEAAEAATLIARNQTAFDTNLLVLTTASGCGAGLSDYLTKHKVQDISAFLLNCDWSEAQINPINMPIYVQDPCTLRNVQKSHQAVYSLLKKIPNANITPLAGNSQCCGGAGTYMLSQSEMANTLLNDKLDAIAANNVSLLATSNIGCSLHIARGLRDKNLNVAILHPIVIIAQQMGYGV